MYCWHPFGAQQAQPLLNYRRSVRRPARTGTTWRTRGTTQGTKVHRTWTPTKNQDRSHSSAREWDFRGCLTCGWATQRQGRARSFPGGLDGHGGHAPVAVVHTSHCMQRPYPASSQGIVWWWEQSFFAVHPGQVVWGRGSRREAGPSHPASGWGVVRPQPPWSAGRGALPLGVAPAEQTYRKDPLPTGPQPLVWAVRPTVGSMFLSRHTFHTLYRGAD